MSVENHLGKDTLEKPRKRWEDHIKVGLGIKIRSRWSWLRIIFNGSFCITSVEPLGSATTVSFG
jgi:hypothetical protein